MFLTDTPSSLFPRSCVCTFGTPAAAMVLQTSGAKINFNPHLHSLVADGVFDEEGVFHELGYLNLSKATKLFSHKVMKYLSKEEVITEDVVQNILSWNHTGFSVWQGEQVKPDDGSYRLFLASYIDRGPVDNSKLVIDESFEKSVFYDDGEQAVEQFYPLEFLVPLLRLFLSRHPQNELVTDPGPRSFSVFPPPMRSPPIPLELW